MSRACLILMLTLCVTGVFSGQTIGGDCNNTPSGQFIGGDCNGGMSEVEIVRERTCNNFRDVDSSVSSLNSRCTTISE